MHAKVIFNYRNIRDAVLSFLRFTHAPAELCIEIAAGMMETTDHYCSVGNAENLLQIRYESLLYSELDTALLIQKFLGLSLSRQTVLEVVESLTKEKVKTLIEKAETLQQLISVNQIKDTSEILPFELVRNFDNTYRVYDRYTGFQSAHITNTLPGEWQTVLSETQVLQLRDMPSSWMHRYGYDESELPGTLETVAASADL